LLTYVAFLPLLLSPVVTFAVFIGMPNGTLGTAKMFTTVNLIGLITQPLSQVFQSIPTIMAAISCMQRIQKYLQTESKSDHRLLLQGRGDNLSPLPDMEDDLELQDLKPVLEKSFHDLHNENAVVVQNGTFGWKAEEPILRDISMSIKASQLTLLIGPVASGKSTLLKAFLGETPSSQGFVYVSSTEVAFCDQTPWLING
jgi:ATP-binding cassette subfamily C (CFTR/MRP) protein 1